MRAKIYSCLLIVLCFSSTAFANNIYEAQVYLNKLGFNAGPPDGIYGSKTRQALENFYSSKGRTFDGVVDAQDIRELDTENFRIHNEIPPLAPLGNCEVKDKRSDTNNYNGPVNFDSSRFLHQKAYDLPDYASFSFGEILGPETPGWSAPEIKAVADFNNDGIDDLVLHYFEAYISPLILYGTTEGLFEQAVVDENAKRRVIRNGSVADFNNDGYLDFVGFTASQAGEKWEAQGFSTHGKKLTRGEKDLLLINTIDGFRELAIPEVRYSDWTHGGDVGDVDNDGLIDILPLSEGGSERTVPLKNKGNLYFALNETEYDTEVSFHLTSDLDSGDFNGDGLLDIAVTMTPSPSRLPEDMNKLGALRVIYGDGEFDFKNNKITRLGTSWLSRTDVGDWQKTADDETIAGSFHESGVFMTGTSHVEAVDLNDDGRDDVLLSYWLSTTGLWKTAAFKAFMSEGNCFTDATDTLFPNQDTNRILDEDLAVNYTHNFHLADINSDGLDDLILQSDGFNDRWYYEIPSAGHPYVFINQGGYWLPALGSDVSYWVDAFQMVAGDFNGDGNADLAFIKRDGPKVWLEVSLSGMRKNIEKIHADSQNLSVANVMQPDGEISEIQKNDTSTVKNVNANAIPNLKPDNGIVLTWSTELADEVERVIEAKDIVRLSNDASKYNLIEKIEYGNRSSDSEQHGREQLDIIITQDERIIIKGAIQIFPDEYIDLDIDEPLAKASVSITFASADKLIISWR